MATSRRAGLNEIVSLYGTDYATTQGWETAKSYDLVTAQVSEVLEYPAGLVAETAVFIGGATTNASYRRTLRPTTACNY